MAFEPLMFESMGTWDADGDGQAENIWRVRNYNAQGVKFAVDVPGSDDPIEDFQHDGTPEGPLIVWARQGDDAFFEVYFYTERAEAGPNTVTISYYPEPGAPVTETRDAKAEPFDLFVENPDATLYLVPDAEGEGAPWPGELSGDDHIEFPDSPGWGYDGSVAFNAGAGNDTLVGGEIFDRLDGNAGDDLITGGQGDDALWGGDGKDTITGDVGNDSIDGGNGGDLLTGLDGDDVLIGGGGADLVLGLDGDDTATGDDGNDILYGFQGADVLEGGAEDDFIEGGAGADTLDGGAGVNLVSYAESHAGVSVDLAANRQAGGDAEGDLLYNFTRVLGSGFGDVITGNAAIPTEIVARGGDDTVTGGSATDVIYGNGGDDVISAGGGDDYVAGGAGNDSISGGEGRDDLYGEDGDDTIRAGDSGPVDLVFGGNGADSLDGEGGTDVLFGEAGDDTVQGGDGDDWVQGDGGDDLLLGGDNPAGTIDWLTGGAGDDTLDGGAGDDWLVGGDGADRFVYGDGGGIDCIADFEPGVDTLLIAPGANGSGIVTVEDLAASGRIWSTGADSIIDLGPVAGTAISYVQLVGVLPEALLPGSIAIGD